MKIASEQEMLAAGQSFAKQLLASRKAVRNSHADIDKISQNDTTGANKTATVIELIGDVGAGKTTFTRGLAAGLGIKEPITSPSYTISKHYTLPSGGELIHYDFYRLPDPGLMADDLAESINGNNIVVIEWGDSITDLLPENHITIKIEQIKGSGRLIQNQ